MASFGLDGEQLLAEKPSLVYATLSAFGQNGPKGHRRGMEITIRAESGMIAVGGQTHSAVAWVDFTSGMMLAQGVLAALRRRDVTGQGGLVDARLLDTAVFLQSVRLAELSATGAYVGGSATPTAGVFRAADGAIAIAVYSDRDFVRLCEALGREDLATDDRYATTTERVENTEQLRREIDTALANRSRQEWCDIFDRAGVMVGSVHETSDLFTDPQLAHNAVFHETTTEDGREVTLVRLPYSLDGESLPARMEPPRLNADRDAVLADLGLTASEIAQLAQTGVVPS
jgi:crotonobetainyl-CoA:carnitine CoA-transferase CaiB-like acyl-CoA transferase